MKIGANNQEMLGKSSWILLFQAPLKVYRPTGGQTLDVTGDRVLMQTDVGTNLGNFYSDQDFLIMDIDSKDLFIGVQWYHCIFR